MIEFERKRERPFIRSNFIDTLKRLGVTFDEHKLKHQRFMDILSGRI